MLALDGKGNLTKQRKLGRATAEQRKVTWSSEEAKSDRPSYTVGGGVGSTASRIDNVAPSKMLLQIDVEADEKDFKEEMNFVPNLYDV